MLGSYNLGAIYLGSSPSVSGYAVIPDSGYIGVISDDFSMLRTASMEIDNSIINVHSDNTILSKYIADIDSSNIGLGSDVFGLGKVIYIGMNKSTHGVETRNTVGITNWENVGVEFGVYLKEFRVSGDYSSTQQYDGGIYYVSEKNKGNMA